MGQNLVIDQNKGHEKRKNLPLHIEHLLRELGEALKMARARRELSLRDMGRKLGISPNTVSRLEQGDQGVNLGVLLLVLDQMDMLDPIKGLTRPESDRTGQNLERRKLLGQGKSLDNEFDF